MRLFVAAGFDDKLKLKLARVMGELSRNTERGNFTRMQNLHLTLQFIGEAENADAAREAVAAVDFESFNIFFDHVSGFKRQGTELSFLGIKEAGKLKMLSEAVGLELRNRGFRLEDRPFAAHLTLGREVIFKRGFEPEKMVLPDDLMSDVNKISLMKSERIKGILTYTEIFSKRASDK